ncbi:hypothetical protein [uncultured Phenylobacterium sp.]|uniref:hypothetical protein n=1 Tax=uncultured Phenylobacterium sp. TaxID=349273 RepID=UPI0025E1E3FA|nr:hypothetical protein [uncultured Phenylobacterium sp.]
MSRYLARLQDPLTAEKIYSACGRLALNWGQLEITVDMLVIHLRARQRHPSTGFKYFDFPVSFTKKRDEIKDRLKKDPPLAPVRPAVTAFLSEAKKLHDIRVTVLHGICEGMRVDGRIAFMISDMKGFGGWRHKYLTLTRIEEAADQMLSLYDVGGPLLRLMPLSDPPTE